MPTLSKSYLIYIGTTSFSLDYHHYRKVYLEAELTRTESLHRKVHSKYTFGIFIPNI